MPATATDEGESQKRESVPRSPPRPGINGDLDLSSYGGAQHELRGISIVATSDARTVKSVGSRQQFRRVGVVGLRAWLKPRRFSFDPRTRHHFAGVSLWGVTLPSKQLQVGFDSHHPLQVQSPRSGQVPDSVC